MKCHFQVHLSICRLHVLYVLCVYLKQQEIVKITSKYAYLQFEHLKKNNEYISFHFIFQIKPLICPCSFYSSLTKGNCVLNLYLSICISQYTHKCYVLFFFILVLSKHWAR